MLLSNSLLCFFQLVGWRHTSDVGDVFSPGALRMKFSRQRFRRLLLIFALRREVPFLDPS